MCENYHYSYETKIRPTNKHQCQIESYHSNHNMWSLTYTIHKAENISVREVKWVNNDIDRKIESIYPEIIHDVDIIYKYVRKKLFITIINKSQENIYVYLDINLRHFDINNVEQSHSEPHQVHFHCDHIPLV